MCHSVFFYENILFISYVTGCGEMQTKLNVLLRMEGERCEETGRRKEEAVYVWKKTYHTHRMRTYYLQSWGREFSVTFIVYVRGTENNKEKQVEWHL
jgi:hypothetical protein